MRAAVMGAALLLSGSAAAAPPDFALEEVVGSLTMPVAVGFAPDGRWLIAEQSGRVRLRTPDGRLAPAPLLDLRAQIGEIHEQFDERGLLGLALHPDFARNRKFYIAYTAHTRAIELTPWQRLIVWLKQIKGRETAALDYWSGELRIVEHRVSADDLTRADDHARPILTVPQPQPTHNAGWLGFGPDGYLYVALGDGGGADDSWEGHAPEGNAQATDRLLGKILRIDVDRGDPYAIPPDNPFADRPGYRPEIWALGFRNPWRCGFDAGGSHYLFCGDVGQNDYEEVSLVQKGRNYGWRRKEGRSCFDVADPHVHPPTCPDADLTDPIIAYRNCTGLGDPCVGRSAVGGYVYRGAAVPELWGQYVFGDFAAGPDMERGLVMRAAPPDWTPEPLRLEPADQLGYVVAFAQDPAGEIYVMTSRTVGTDTTDDRIYRIGRQPPEREGAM